VIRSARQILGLLLALTSTLAACQNDFDKPNLVIEPTLLGAHVEVIGDSSRATPKPGESVHVQLALVGRPGSYKVDDVSTMMVVCKYPNRFTGIPVCQEFLDFAALSPDELKAMFGDLYVVDPSQLRLPCEGNISASALGVTLNCIAGAPELDMPISADTSGDLLLRGVVCTSGQAVFDPTLPELFGCDGAGEDAALAFHSRLTVTTQDAAENNNPDPGAVTLTIDGRAFDSLPDPRVRSHKCAEDPGNLILLDPYDHRVGFEVPRMAREKVPSGGRETWEFAVYTTTGEVLNRFAFISDQDTSKLGDPTLKTVTWDGTGLVSYGESRVVDFWITVRDQRGGFTILPRSVCVDLPDPIR